MKYLDHVPADVADGGRKLPPGGGLLIAFGGSFLFWALLVWAVL
ncbi:MAG: hypothetical protein WDN24_18485 [Sphingomonas sp.]